MPNEKTIFGVLELVFSSEDGQTGYQVPFGFKEVNFEFLGLNKDRSRS